MEHELAQGSKMLNGILSIVVTLLVGTLLAVVVSFLLWSVGVF